MNENAKNELENTEKAEEEKEKNENAKNELENTETEGEEKYALSLPFCEECAPFAFNGPSGFHI